MGGRALRMGRGDSEKKRSEQLRGSAQTMDSRKDVRIDLLLKKDILGLRKVDRFQCGVYTAVNGKVDA